MVNESKLDILIVLQSHSKFDAWNLNSKDKKRRYVGASKLEISKRCFRSLLRTIRYCQEKESTANYRLIVLDDDSDQEFIDLVHFESSRSIFPIKLEHTKVRGIMPSIGRMFEIGKEQGKHLVYFAQDDYLYYETALWEMIDAYINFKVLSGMNICIFPYNDPYRRHPKIMHKLLKGTKRYWFTDIGAACCIMVSKETLDNNWDVFKIMGELPYDEFCEDKSINRLFGNFKELPERKIDHVLFVPVDSLALHLGYESERDPYIDWKELWNQFTEMTDTVVKIPTDKSIVVNLGAGMCKISDSLFAEDLLNHHEVRVDADANVIPDVCTDIKKLKMFLNDSIDVVYSSHSLEHVAFHEVRNCLLEWYRIIKPNGEIRIIVPNLKHISSYVASGRILDPIYESPAGPIAAIDILYGYKEFVVHNEYMQHKTGFTKESITDILLSLSFQKFSVTEVETNLLIQIVKPQAIPQ